MSIQLSEAQLKSAARAATWEQIKVMYEPELEQYASEREKLARIEELDSIDYGCEDTDENTSMLEHIMQEGHSTMDGRSLANRLKHLKKQLDKGE